MASDSKWYQPGFGIFKEDEAVRKRREQAYEERRARSAYEQERVAGEKAHEAQRRAELGATDTVPKTGDVVAKWVGKGLSGIAGWFDGKDKAAVPEATVAATPATTTTLPQVMYGPRPPTQSKYETMAEEMFNQPQDYTGIMKIVNDALVRMGGDAARSRSLGTNMESAYGERTSEPVIGRFMDTLLRRGPWTRNENILMRRYMGNVPSSVREVDRRMAEGRTESIGPSVAPDVLSTIVGGAEADRATKTSLLNILTGLQAGRERNLSEEQREITRAALGLLTKGSSAEEIRKSLYSEAAEALGSGYIDKDEFLEQIDIFDQLLSERSKPTAANTVPAIRPSLIEAPAAAAPPATPSAQATLPAGAERAQPRTLPYTILNAARGLGKSAADVIVEDQAGRKVYRVWSGGKWYVLNE